MIVSLDGSGDFTSIQAAIDAVPEQSRDRTIIHIKNGLYREKVHITKPRISLSGESRDNTVILWNDFALMKDDKGENINTFQTYTLFAGGDDFIAENLTVENGAGPGKVVGQAVALYADGDRTIIKNCRIIGNQDTLFTGPLPPFPLTVNKFGGPRDGMPRVKSRQYYEDCYIKGDVDFIFGSATAVFKSCEIVSNDPGQDINGYITAASTPQEEKFGYVFIDCRLTSSARPESIYLGRPWRNYAKTVFINCFMGEHIKHEGWSNWDKPESEKTVEYAEYNSQGPGSQIEKRVGWAKALSGRQSKIYNAEKVLRGKDGWNPASTC
jgi:pectinesterase